MLVAVHQDVTGGAQALALSYAKALGGTRAGAIATSVEVAAETALFGEYGVAGAVIDGLISAGFDTLVVGWLPAGSRLHRLRPQPARSGRAGRGRGCGPHDRGSLVEYARRTGGARLADEHLREMLRRALASVRDGTLAADFIEDRAAGSAQLETLRANADRHPVVATGRRVRRLLPWIATTTSDARHAR